MFRRLFTALPLIATLAWPSSPVAASELTIYAIPSPKAIDWSSPSSLARTTANNFLVPDLHWSGYDLGHAAVSFKCESRETVLAGLRAGPHEGNFALLMKKKIGLGILFHAYPGRVQTEAELLGDLRERARSGRMGWLRFQISPKTCARLSTYWREYLAQGLDRRYGVHLQPRRREGAGNTSFAVSFLEVAGVLTAELRSHWERTVLVNDELIGRERAPVGLTSILFTRHWSNVAQPHRRLSFYDPNLMYRAIIGAWSAQFKNGSPAGITLDKDGRAPGLIIDARQVPTPAEPIWKP